MTPYRKTFRNATRAAFAREAAIDAFGPRARWTLSEAHFENREPHEGPRPIGKVAAEVVEDVGRRAVAHWLKEACQAEDEEREAALQIADNIRQSMGLEWVDLIGWEAA